VFRAVRGGTAEEAAFCFLALDKEQDEKELTPGLLLGEVKPHVSDSVDVLGILLMTWWVGGVCSRPGEAGWAVYCSHT
jgi:hypothetical protein